MSDQRDPADGLRAADTDREQVAEALREALGQGRLDMGEFSERLDRLYRTRTYGELRPLLADLPAESAGAPVVAGESVEIRRRGSRIERVGRWAVPRRLRVDSVAAPVVLDFSSARIGGNRVDIELAVRYGPTTLILPAGATADISEVDVRWAGSRSRVPNDPVPGAVHFRVTGLQVAAPLRVRYRSRFARR